MEPDPPRSDFVSQSGGLDATYVSLHESEALTLCTRHYGLGGRLTRFATEKDDTFRVDADDGRKYVLKIANPFEVVDELGLQVELLRHIESTAPELPVPRVFADSQGSMMPSVTTSAGDQRRMRLMSFLAGTPLDQTSCNAIQRQRIGQLLGRLRHATCDFSHVADSRVVAWDVKHLGSLTHLLSHVTDAGQRTDLETALDKFHSIESRLATCRTQVLHNDFNTSNLVVDPASDVFLTGIIDFGDAVRTAIAIDVSTALMNQFPRGADWYTATGSPARSDLFADPRDLLRGYLQVADLTTEEMALIPFLAMGRVVTRALISTWRAKLFPQNSAYILRHTAPGWAHLRWFVERSNDQIADTLITTEHSNSSRIPS